MNRYIAAGVLADMRAGRRVLVLSETRHLARLAFAEVATGAMGGELVRRANGRERIHAAYGQGSVAFGSGRTSFRGFTFDVVVFDDYHPGPDALQSIAPNLVTSPVGEVIRPQCVRRPPL